MMPHTIDSNFTFYYDGKAFGRKTHSGARLECTFAKATRPHGNFKEECLLAMTEILHIAETMGRKPQLLLSGGLDSEVLAMVMMELGADVSPLTFRFTDGSNSHEIDQVMEFTSRHNLVPTFLDINIREWIFTPEARQFALDGECSDVNLLPHMKLMLHSWNSGHFPIMGNREFYAVRTPSTSHRMSGSGEPFEWTYCEYEIMMSLNKFAIHHGILGSINTFQFTPELYLSMMDEPEILKCLNGGYAHKMSTRSSKYEVYHRHWPALTRRPKFHGAEKLRALYAEAAEHYALPFNNTLVWSLPVNDFKQSIT